VTGETGVFARPSVTVDLVVLTLVNNQLHLLLIERGEAPFQGRWALPGGFVNVGDAQTEQGESVEEAAHRELEEETGLAANTVFLEQLYTFGKPYRDPRTRVITVAWFALIPPHRVTEVKSGTDASDAGWFPVGSLPLLAFDHGEIVETALQRLRRQLGESPVGFELVPPAFTIAELRNAHEIILGQRLDAGNFRRRFMRWVEDGRVCEAPGRRKTASKPARLYSRVERVGGN
jgi:8-oxo-dGTP diphosphatase